MSGEPSRWDGWRSRVSSSSVAALRSLLGRSRHLDQAVLVEPEEPPALLLGQILGAAPLVELDRRLVVLRHHEHHAGAASLHGQLGDIIKENILTTSTDSLIIK